MTVHDLIEKLKTLPPDANVGLFFDGADRWDVDVVWLAKSGRVVLGEYAEVKDSILYDKDKPQEGSTILPPE